MLTPDERTALLAEAERLCVEPWAADGLPSHDALLARIDAVLARGTGK